MIQTDYGLAATRKVLAHLEDALRDLTQKRATYHPATFALIAAPIVEAIQTHRAEIDEYIGFIAAAQAGTATPAPAHEPLTTA